MGDADIRKAAETSNRLLERPVQALKKGGLSEGSEVGKTLLELRRTVEVLKLRGGSHLKGEQLFTIQPGHGLVVVPQESISLEYEASGTRLPTGLVPQTASPDHEVRA